MRGLYVFFTWKNHAHALTNYYRGGIVVVAVVAVVVVVVMVAMVGVGIYRCRSSATSLTILYRFDTIIQYYKQTCPSCEKKLLAASTGFKWPCVLGKKYTAIC